MKIIVGGSRDFDDYSLLKEKLDLFFRNLDKEDIEIVCGKARGADTLGEQYALENNLKITYFPADWSKFGYKAGYIRNKEMANYADALVAFWDGKSRGTKHMINLAEKLQLKVKVVEVERIEGGF